MDERAILFQKSIEHEAMIHDTLGRVRHSVAASVAACENNTVPHSDSLSSVIISALGFAQNSAGVANRLYYLVVA